MRKQERRTCGGQGQLTFHAMDRNHCVLDWTDRTRHDNTEGYQYKGFGRKNPIGWAGSYKRSCMQNTEVRLFPRHYPPSLEPFSIRKLILSKCSHSITLYCTCSGDSDSIVPNLIIHQTSWCLGQYSVVLTNNFRVRFFGLEAVLL